MKKLDYTRKERSSLRLEFSRERPEFHTSEFMDGYNDGYSSCSSQSGGGSSGSGRHFEDNPLLGEGCAALADPIPCETARGIIHGLRSDDGN
jgi:hypothetical protein